MNIAKSPAVNKPKTGTCPHGLPPSACPICSGMGGGGGASAKKAQRPAGEMSYEECYAVWQQMLKAREIAQQKKLDALHAQMQPQITFTDKIGAFAQKLASLSERLTDFNEKLQNLPKIISKPILLATKIFAQVLNIMKDVSIFAQKAINLIQQKFTDISDKLNAIFGEMKNSLEKKVSDNLKNVKKRFKSLFGIFEPTETDDEEKRTEENKRIFEMKTILHTLREKLFNKEEITHGNQYQSN